MQCLWAWDFMYKCFLKICISAGLKIYYFFSCINLLFYIILFLVIHLKKHSHSIWRKSKEENFGHFRWGKTSTVIFWCQKKSCSWVQWLNHDLIISFQSISSLSIPVCPNMGNLVKQTFFHVLFKCFLHNVYLYLKAVVHEMVL